MSGAVQSIRGIHDILPADAALWFTLEAAATEVFAAYGYQQIRLPILERTELFKRAVGEVTDIVEKEMYSFEDRGGDSIALRPEGTAGCVRAGIEHGLLHNQIQRLWYHGPMFRYERPQKGRYRQFHQFGVETFGVAGPAVEIELIAMSARLWRKLGISGLSLQLNSLGTLEERQAYRQTLVDYFSDHRDRLDDDSLRRLDSNPLRILDSKNPALADLIGQAPELLEHLGSESADHFAEVRAGLETLGIDYQLNFRLVRGLDYYTRTVFEWRTDQLGAQDAVCSGGRFDGLVDWLGGRATPAVGFAMGVERLLALMQILDCPLRRLEPAVYVVTQGDKAARLAVSLCEELRDRVPRLRLMKDVGGGSFKSQFKRADKSGAHLALVLGDTEADSGQVQIKPLRSDAAQQTIAVKELAAWLETHVPPTH